MRIYVLRHAIAEPRRAGKPDAQRKLTAAGRQKLSRVLDRAKAAGVRPSVILSSPLARALETAGMASQTLGYRGRVARTEALDPASDPQKLWEEIRARKDAKSLLVTGHEPHLSAAIAYLLGTPALSLDLKKGALARIDVDSFDGEPKGVLKWILTPALA